MIWSIFYYVLGGMINLFTKLLPKSTEITSTTEVFNALAIIFIEIGKWNYIFPVYAIMKSIGIAVAFEMLLGLTKLIMKGATIARGGGQA